MRKVWGSIPGPVKSAQRRERVHTKIFLKNQINRLLHCTRFIEPAVVPKRGNDQWRGPTSRLLRLSNAAPKKRRNDGKPLATLCQI